MKQARAADAQANAAHQQVEVGRAQVRAAEMQYAELLQQGNASRRPVFKVTDTDPAFMNNPARLRNVGAGLAIGATWRFVKPIHEVRDYPIGTLAPNNEMVIPWPFNKEDPKLPSDMIERLGICIHCYDTAGNEYCTRSARTTVASSSWIQLLKYMTDTSQQSCNKTPPREYGSHRRT